MGWWWRRSTAAVGAAVFIIYLAGLANTAQAAHISANNETRPTRKRVEYSLDHRECFSEIDSQDDCGACYLFAGLSVLEYHFCRLTGERVKFSAQFPLDCAADGCDGGHSWQVIEFSYLHGVERAQTYPYMMEKRTCPYGKMGRTSTRKSGYWRISGLRWRQVKLSDYERELENGPILVHLSVPEAFDDYSGGLDELDCRAQGSQPHAMVLVGQGRERNVDFWLLRNSYSASWGEQGYYRVSKSAFARCHDYDNTNGMLIEGNIKFAANPDHDSVQMVAELEKRQRRRRPD